MTFETAWRAVSLFLKKNGRRGCRRIKFFGGEPLLCFRLIKNIVEKTNKRHKNVRFRLPTNGMLINNDVLSFLGDNANVELVISSNNIGLLEKKKTLLKKILELPLVTINMNFLPARIKESERKFIDLHGHGFSRFNFLPAYFTLWKKGEIALLGKSLKKIAGLPAASSGKIYVDNLEVESDVPLFNLSPSVDQEGDIMAGNFFMDERFYRWKNELRLGNIRNESDWEKIFDLSFDFDFLIEKTFPADIINSNTAVDRKLNHFVNLLKAN